MALLIIQLSLFSCYVIPPKFKYSPQHAFYKHSTCDDDVMGFGATLTRRQMPTFRKNLMFPSSIGE